MVQPVPGPASTANALNISSPLEGSNQNLKLFKRGKHMSGVPNNTGNKRFPKPPIRIGMTIKKIIKRA